MGVHNKGFESGVKSYTTARRIRSILSDGKTRTLGEIARELDLTYQAVNGALTTLTNIEPNLAENDDNSLFIAIGG